MALKLHLENINKYVKKVYMIKNILLDHNEDQRVLKTNRKKAQYNNKSCRFEASSLTSQPSKTSRFLWSQK